MASAYLNKKIVVADNASSDGSVDWVKERYPSVEILVNTQNDGFAGGYNWALKRVQAVYYVLLNSDVRVTPGWIGPIIELMEKDPAIAACQPKLLSLNHPDLFEYAGAAGGWIDTLGYPFSRGRIFDVLEKDEQQYDDIQEIFWASGAALFIKSHIFHEMEGFDAGFFAHQEEIDLCWRMQLAGYKIYVCPQSVVYHVGAGTLPRGGRKVFLNFRNNLIMMSKNLSAGEKRWKFPLRILLDSLSAWKGLMTGDLDFFKAIAKAHFAVLKRYIKTKKCRAINKRPMNSLGGVYAGSLVIQHFVRHKKFFRQIVDKKSL
jgi:GT2 family glycosyltransferase